MKYELICIAYLKKVSRLFWCYSSVLIVAIKIWEVEKYPGNVESSCKPKGFEIIPEGNSESRILVKMNKMWIALTLMTRREE